MSSTAELYEDDSDRPVPQPPPPSWWRYPNRAGVIRPFRGWLLARESSMTPASRRWTEMEVYRKVTGEYVLRVLGCSVVYHTRGSACNTGQPQRGRDMDLDMLPCRNCRPPDYLREDMQDTVFDVEVDIPGLYLARTPRVLLMVMQDSQTGEMTYLAARLLAKLRGVEPAVDQELSAEQPI